MEQLTEHYLKNHKKLIKRLSFTLGTIWDGEDCVHEAYANALQYKKSFKEDGDFSKWFNAILNNCIAKHRNKDRTTYPPEDPEETLLELPSGLLEDVKALIDREPEGSKEVLRLHFLLDYTAMDVSKVTPHTYANAAKVIQRFRNKVRQIYDC